MKFSIGSDPELILLNKSGIPTASVGLIGGSKEIPRRTKNGWVLEDNVLAEFNTKPSQTAEEFVRNHQLVMRDLSELMAEYDLQLSVQATAIYDEDQLDSGQAREAGCEPDYNAWEDGRKNDRPQFNGGLRSCGGHVHVAFPKPNEYPTKRLDMVKVMDVLLGVPSIILDRNEERRKLYGKAGACRLKYKKFDHPYDGVEYRVLSNFWLANDKLMAWVFSQTEQSIIRFKEIIGVINDTEGLPEAVVHTINTGNRDTAWNLVDLFDVKMPG